MATPARLAPLLEQYEHATHRLLQRLRGPEVDSGDGEPVPVQPLSDAEYLWEPAPGSWSVRRRTDPPAPGASVLVGTGEWGRDGGPRPLPPPVTTIAWRMQHLASMLAGRADWTVGARTFDDAQVLVHGGADAAVADLERSASAWRAALLAADDAALDTVGHSAYPWGGDPDEPFLAIVWWVNQEVLHHGAEIALLRDLYRARG